MLRATHLAGFGCSGGIVMWNPNDKGANITLSNNNLTAAGATAWNAVRANRSVRAGKWYWEVKVDVLNTSNFHAGAIATSAATLTNYAGFDANSWAYFPSGLKFNNNTSAAYGAAYTDNDIIGVKLDLDAGNLEFLKNNTSQGVAYSSLSGEFYPFVASFSGTGTARFAAKDFSYAIPAGYSPLL